MTDLPSIAEKIAYRLGIEDAAKIADCFTCGECGMDGKASAAIRAVGGATSAPRSASYVIVPREPTDAMLNAGCAVRFETPEMARASVAGTHRNVARVKMKLRWQAMLAGAPPYAATIATMQERVRLLEVVDGARRYRAAETDGTPRMWRGKQIQDLANELDDALAGLEPAPPQDGAAAATGETGERDG